MIASEGLVEIRDLVREYRVGSGVVRAVDGIDLEIGRGEFLAIVGRSGSGKSTLLQMVGGLDTPTGGILKVGGRELQALSPYERALYRRETVGFVFQSFHLIPSMTAERNVALALALQGRPRAGRDALAREALDRVGIAARAGHKPGQLSGGEQQRVALARAIVHRPPLLLADEPTGNLDRATADEVLGLLKAIQKDLGTTVVIVTHDVETAGRLADRTIALSDGRIVGAAGGGSA